MNSLLKRLKFVVADEDDEIEEVVCENVEDLKKYISDIEDYACSPYEFSSDYFPEMFESYFPVSDSNYEQNSDVYNQIGNFDFDDYCNDIDHESLKESYKDNFESYVDDSDVVFDTYSFDWDNIEDELWAMASENSDIESDFEEAKQQYIEKCEDMPGFNTNGDDGNEEEYMEEDESEGDIDLQDVAEMEDSVGDTHTMTDKVDYDTRDKAFVYIDGEIYEGNNGETHSNIVQRVLQESGNEDKVTDKMKSGQINNSRPSQTQMKRLFGTEEIAFGHVVDDCAFIEVLSNGATIDEVANACEKDYDKVYQFSQNQGLIKRVASKQSLEEIVRGFGFRPFVIENLGTALMGKYVMITMQEGFPKVDVAVSASMADEIDNEKFDEEIGRAIMLCKAMGKLKLYKQFK